MPGTQRFAVTNPLRAFGITWFGQLVSLLGSGMTSYALGVKVYRESGSVTQYALITFFYVLPFLLVSPVAGALIDRWDRRRAMLLSDIGSGFGFFLIWVLLMADKAGLWHLEFWHFYPPLFLSSCFAVFRWPAYSAAITLLVPKQHLGRASGLVELAGGLGQALSPLLATPLLLHIQFQGVLLVDLGTFLFAVLTLLVVRFPAPQAREGKAERKSIRREMALGWQFIRERPGLYRLIFFGVNVTLLFNLVILWITPLVLGFTDINTLGRIASMAGVGMVLGGVVMSVWGGPRRRVAGAILVHGLSGGLLLLAGLPPSVPLVAAAAALFLFAVPIVSGSVQALWQSKVPPHLQGRVFAVRRMASQTAGPVASLLAGPLADRLFEPWLVPGGALAGSVGALIGTGKGRGVAFLFLVLAVLTGLNALLTWSSPRVRGVEEELPDGFGQPAAKDAVRAASA
ncbi:MAG TPA: MFS transporter [Polyangia bacterium]|jgi:MFS family permease|nr:MFS transporter [Polyangia bacterium]